MCRPFTRADAVRAGIDPKVLRTSRFRRIFRGVYISSEAEVTPWLRTEAALVLHPKTAFASHLSAARAFKLPVPHHAEEHVTVRRACDRRKHAGIRNHVAAETEVVELRGMRLSHPFRMFLELASMLSLVDLVVVGDAMLRVFDIPAQRLLDECARSSDRHARAARRAAAYVRERVDSPMETRLRMLIVLAGLPEPEVNLPIVDEYGVERRRMDLSYPSIKLIVEYDGRQHADDVVQWESDLVRREEFDDDGWQILIVTAKGIYREPLRTLTRVRHWLVKRGHPDVPATFDDEWRVHFPGRQ